MAQENQAVKAGARVIIVEDDQPLRNSVVKYLTLEGYEVTGVSSAHEFYQCMFAEPYAVAVLDVGLPDQSGMVLTEYVRKNTDMRIIMFTALASIEDQLAGQQAGADVYLVKPVDFRQLSAAIASLLRRLAESSAPRQFTIEKPQQQSTGTWRLISKQWTLQTPQGDSIILTTKELDFMVLLVSTPQKVVSRPELLEKLGYINNESGNHSLQSLINRLRSKMVSYQLLDPIKTAHTVGYSFSADIAVD
ncbi:MAG: response regulator transcription factor [Chlorobiaceae bacterium]|nr:response regulator transcription factor [Chlorobiaceae bacterium]